MIRINIFKKLFGSKTSQEIKLISETNSHLYTYDGNIYKSDIVRACIRPTARAVGKLIAKHIRETNKIEINPEPYLAFLLSEPNPLMSGQKLQEKLATQLLLNNNAFAVIWRDDNGVPREIYPINANLVEPIYSDNKLFLKFTMENGNIYTFDYTNIIHLRQDFYKSEIFGDSIASSLTPLMEVIGTIDTGIVKAVNNSSVVRWLLKFTSNLNKDDIKDRTREFAEAFTDTQNGTGVAGVASNADAVQVQPYEYIPNASQMARTTERIYSLFGVNEKIIQSRYSENEWNSYYEAIIEPIAIDLQNEYTRKLFTRHERAFGNRIAFESSNLTCASVTTRLNLMQMVDRGALTPNEWRRVFNLAPVDGGDEPIRRLDTAPVNNVN